MRGTRRSQGERGSTFKGRGCTILLESGAPITWTAQSLSRIVMTIVEELLRRHPMPIPPPTKLAEEPLARQEKQSWESITHDPPTEDLGRLQEKAPRQKKVVTIRRDTPSQKVSLRRSCRITFNLYNLGSTQGWNHNSDLDEDAIT